MSVVSSIGSYCSKISLSDLRCGWQAVNGAAAILVAKKFFSTPSANDLEWLTDAAIHGYQSITGDKSETSFVVTCIGLNAFRLSAIAYYAYQGNSTIPLVLNVVDLGLHLGNMASSVSVLVERKYNNEFLYNEKHQENLISVVWL